jgi:predicted membrane-bound mannosyltransferase
MLTCSKDGEWVGWSGLWDVLTDPEARLAPLWTEALVLGLALLGMIAAFTRRGIATASASLVRFLAFYTLLVTIAYSSIPYKTPWCMIGFLHGMILLAGVGAVALVRRLRRRPLQIAAVLVLIAGGLHLGVEAHEASFRYHSDACNPYAYAQTYTNIFKLRDRIEELAAVDGGRSMGVKVISPENYWPLPWYLRAYERVGYWDQVPASPDAPVIVASPAIQADLDAKLRDRYQQETFGLRPGANLVLYVKRDLWDAFMAARMGPPPK